MAELYFGHKISLNFIDSETYHKVGNNLALTFGLADDLDRLIDVEQYL